MLKIDKLKDRIAHGSGIDLDWSIDYHILELNDLESINTLRCNNSYHAMNERGFYVGWVNFTAYYTLDLKLVHLEIDQLDINAIQAQFNDVYLDDLDDYLWQTLEIIEE